MYKTQQAKKYYGPSPPRTKTSPPPNKMKHIIALLGLGLCIWLDLSEYFLILLVYIFDVSKYIITAGGKSFPLQAEKVFALKIVCSNFIRN